jgi:SAM-dependent methyltransferase
MNKQIEKFMYSFGITCMAVPRSELRLLMKKLPEEFKNRHITEFGCGDGRVSMELKKILEAKTYKGIDLYEPLVASARKRGIDADVHDATRNSLSGDVALFWGSLHHMENALEVLRNIKENFNSLIIREAVDYKGLFHFTDIGEKFHREDFMELLSAAGIKNHQIIESEKIKAVIVLANF